MMTYIKSLLLGLKFLKTTATFLAPKISNRNGFHILISNFYSKKLCPVTPSFCFGEMLYNAWNDRKYESRKKWKLECWRVDEDIKLELLSQVVPTFCKNRKIWLPSDTTMVSPSLLVKHGVSVSRSVQHPGQFIVVFPK